MFYLQVFLIRKGFSNDTGHDCQWNQGEFTSYTYGTNEMTSQYPYTIKTFDENDSTDNKSKTK